MKTSIAEVATMPSQNKSRYAVLLTAAVSRHILAGFYRSDRLTVSQIVSDSDEQELIRR